MANEWRDRVTLKQGDITQARVDAIVNAANNDLILGAGDALGPIAVGEAAITGGGQLAAPYVIHAASMRLGGRATAEALRSSTRNALLIAKAKDLKSIAFPAIGTGVAGFPPDQCAQVMLDEIRSHLLGPTTIERVEIVLFDMAALATFERIFASISD
jgi:O-acetyl-ADP-ribose deacetylase